MHALAGRLAGLNLTASEINVLGNLADGRPETVSELAAAAGTPASTLTSVLDRLDRRGHITRGHPPADRRAVRVELTPAGRRAANTIRHAVTDLEQQVLGSLPADVIAGLRAALDALAEVPE